MAGCRFGTSTLGFLLLAFSFLLERCSAYHITFVVSVCRETHLEFVDKIFSRLAEGPHHHSAEVLYYCKCTKNKTATGKACMNLDNIGRETSSYLSYFSENHRTMVASKQHLLVMLSGGSGSKQHALGDITRMADTLATNADPPAFMDASAFPQRNPTTAHSAARSAAQPPLPRLALTSLLPSPAARRHSADGGAAGRHAPLPGGQREVPG